MNLQNRELKMKTQGDDVALLQSELISLGYKIDKSETEKSYFGETTSKAVIEFQEKNKLKPSGIVDKETADLINQTLNKDKFIVSGKVYDQNSISFEGCIVQAYDRDLHKEQFLGWCYTRNLLLKNNI